jgi:hypothetical protein
MGAAERRAAEAEDGLKRPDTEERLVLAFSMIRKLPPSLQRWHFQSAHGATR